MMTIEEMETEIAASRRRIWQGWLDNVADGRRYETEMSGQESPNTWVNYRDKGRRAGGGGWGLSWRPNTWVNYRDKGSLRLVTVWYTTKSGEPFMLINLQGKEVSPPTQQRP